MYQKRNIRSSFVLFTFLDKNSTIFFNLLNFYYTSPVYNTFEAYIITIDGLINFLKKKGFWDTYQILIQLKGHKTDIHSFYKKLNEFSYYNSFFRVKDELINKGLIEIVRVARKKYIKLTKKGVEVYNKLSEINDLIFT